MGVTIHFKGQLKDANSYDKLLEIVQSIAATNDWPSEPIASEHATLLRVTDDEREWDYEGPVKGIVLYSHPDAEALRLEFDRDLYIQEYVKTQFAGPATHIAVINFLKQIQHLFLSFSVNDEGEYWDTDDALLLGDHIASCRQAIEDQVVEHPRSSVMIRKSNGRIIDLIQQD